jgi:hypothetical protein
VSSSASSTEVSKAILAAEVVFRDANAPLETTVSQAVLNLRLALAKANPLGPLANVKEQLDVAILPRLMHYVNLYLDHCSAPEGSPPCIVPLDLVLDCFWTLTNLAAGDAATTRLLVKHGAVPLAVRAVPAWLAAEMDLPHDYLRQLQRDPALWLRARPGQRWPPAPQSSGSCTSAPQLKV